MYKCLDCGAVFDEPITTHEGGYPEEPTAACPMCKSLDIDEAERCPICEEVFVLDEIDYGVCDECLEKAVTKENAFGLGDEDRQEVSLNGFMAWLYSADEIEHILEADFRRTSDDWQRTMIRDYCLSDKYDFAKYVEAHHDD